jgi:uncharacterized protein YyaL (SSP411 family)
MLASFAEAGAALNHPEYLEAARRNADFLLSNLRRDGLLLRTYKDGVAKFNAYLEDYAFLIEGLVTLYETTGETRWLDEALTLTDRMIDEFWDKTNGGFYFTGNSHEELIVRSKDYFDNATPSGNSVAALVLQRLAILTENEAYRKLAIAVLNQIADSARKYPSGFGYALSAVDFLLATPKEIAVIASDPASLNLFLSDIWGKYLPNKVVAARVNEQEIGGNIALLRNRGMIDDKTTAYVCENYVCKEPVTELDSLRRQLAPQ